MFCSAFWFNIKAELLHPALSPLLLGRIKEPATWKTADLNLLVDVPPRCKQIIKPFSALERCNDANFGST